MADVDVKLNMAGLVAISNIVNDTIAYPMAQSMAKSGQRVQKTPRSSTKGWARSRVIGNMSSEVRSGALSRVLGG